MASQITDLINPMRLRLGIKRAFTGDIGEILGELFQNSQPAGARNVWIITDATGFVDTSNWDVESVDFTVGGADPQEFYRADAWAGFDPNNDDGRSYDEMTDSYGESCEREIRKVIGNAIPRNFSWDDLIRFVPEGERIKRILLKLIHILHRRHGQPGDCGSRCEPLGGCAYEMGEQQEGGSNESQ